MISFQAAIIKIIPCLIWVEFAFYIGPDVKIKAAGGISSLEDAEKFIELGASRLGTSRIVKIAKGLKNDGTY